MAENVRDISRPGVARRARQNENYLESQVLCSTPGELASLLWRVEIDSLESHLKRAGPLAAPRSLRRLGKQ